MSSLPLEERFQLVRSVGEEIISEADLRTLMEKKPNIRCYDGFEPSGRMHIAQGIFKAINVNKCTTAGCEFVFWVADWFALMNDKVGGELAKIGIVGRYLIEVWKAAGMDMTNVKFLWSSEEITKHAELYWLSVLDIGRRNSLARIKKCCTIMGKQEGTLTAAQVLYPLMQCADIFFLKADICQLGLDQRKVNMLAREYCDLIGRKLKPVIVSHHMMAGLKQGQAKMSKSDPESAIFMEDTAEDVERKIRAAYCPCKLQTAAKVTEDGAPVSDEDKNPVLDYIACAVFGVPNATLEVAGVTYPSYNAVENAFLTGVFGEEALKTALITAINGLLDPVRRHFEANAEANELLELVKSYRKDGKALALSATPPPTVSETPLLVAWMPVMIKLPVDMALRLIEDISTFFATHGNTAAVKLVLPNWSAFARDDVGGEEKTISAALEYNVVLMQNLGLPSKVELVKQGDMILQNRSDYWVCAINAGRKYQLQKIEEVLGGEIKNAGCLVGCLMRVADAVLLKATHVLSTAADLGQNTLVEDFSGGAINHIPHGPAQIPKLNNPAVVATGPENPDETLYVDDTDMDIKRKIKRAYCAPNEKENGVVALGSWWIGKNGSLEIQRNEQNGGNKVYTQASALEEDAESGALHPGDLKISVSLALLNISSDARKELTTPSMKKHAQTLRNAEKKLKKN